MVEINGYLDVAQVVLYAFWAFFALLVWYLQQESRREGYPLEDDLTGSYNKDAFIALPTPKVFKLPHGMGERVYPNPENRDTRPIAAVRASKTAGSALIPTGDNPMKDCVGPASWAERPDHPDMTPHGTAKIRPLSALPEFAIAEGDADPVGMPVFGGDGEQIGEISEVWVDQTENYIRYLEMKSGNMKRLIPLHFAVQHRRGGLFGVGDDKRYYVHNLTAKLVKDIPTTKKPDEITMLEEEKIMAYLGGGGLYAIPERAEPVV
ncbi:MAG: photosynthetic reaction center subunit H [Pseudomonadota bacterium]